MAKLSECSQYTARVDRHKQPRDDLILHLLAYSVPTAAYSNIPTAISFRSQGHLGNSYGPGHGDLDRR